MGIYHFNKIKSRFSKFKNTEFKTSFEIFLFILQCWLSNRLIFLVMDCTSPTQDNPTEIGHTGLSLIIVGATFSRL